MSGLPLAHVQAPTHPCREVSWRMLLWKGGNTPTMSRCFTRSQLQVALHRTWIHGGCGLLRAALASWRQPQHQSLLCCVHIQRLFILRHHLHSTVS